MQTDRQTDDFQLYMVVDYVATTVILNGRSKIFYSICMLLMYCLIITSFQSKDLFVNVTL